jgi:hypothetical protein
VRRLACLRGQLLEAPLQVVGDRPGGTITGAVTHRTDLARRAFAALDLTSLGEDDTPATIEARGRAAVGVATVANFLDGAADAAPAPRGSGY